MATPTTPAAPIVSEVLASTAATLTWEMIDSLYDALPDDGSIRLHIIEEDNFCDTYNAAIDAATQLAAVA